MNNPTHDTHRLSLKDWNLQDRPREKLISLGSRSLSNAELLAILLRSGSKELTAVDLAKQILHYYKNDLKRLANVSPQELIKFKGIGQAKAVGLLAALELAKRSARNQQRLVKITSSEAVYLCMEPSLGQLPHEEFWVLYLNNANHVLSKKQLSKGGYTATVVDVRLILKEALSLGAVSLILVHNHPSGVLDPSQADHAITQKVKKAAAAIDVKVLDHLIIGSEAYYSFADQNTL